VPLFLLGHGLGALIVLRYLEEYPGVGVRGAVLSAPLLGAPLRVASGRKRLTRLLRYVAPALPVSTGLDPASESDDPDVVASYRRDPMIHDRMTPRLLQEADREIEVAVRKRDRIRAPTLWLLTPEDRIVGSDVTGELAAAMVLRTEGSRVRRYTGVHYHELLQEASRSGAVADMLGWIERRLVT
jgi:alpha-beta hydrolase superfamily lysophospholipase